MFDINNTKVNADAMVTEALRMAFDIQAWAVKPGMVGGRTSGETIADIGTDARYGSGITE